MNLFSKFVGALIVLAAVPSFARELGTERMRDCGGYITLKQASNGDLSVQLEGLDTYYCNDLRFTDASSGRELQSYTIRGTNYTLSKEHRRALSSDCEVNVTVSGRAGRDSFVISLPWCSASGGGSGGGSAYGRSYQLSNSQNCKLMLNGSYSQRNVDRAYCQGARGNDVVTYEYSNNRNCKLMINGDYAQQNVSSAFCEGTY